MQIIRHIRQLILLYRQTVYPIRSWCVYLLLFGAVAASAAAPVVAKEGTIAQGLREFVEKAPMYDSVRAKATRVVKLVDDEYGKMYKAFDTRSPKEIEDAEQQDLTVLQNFKELFLQLVKQDDEIRRMGFCAENVEKYVFPRLTKLRFTNNKDGANRGIYDYWDGTMSIELFQDGKTREVRDMLHTLLHEFSHIFGYGEDAANLFAEVLMGEGDGVAARERHDWVYGSHQLRGILRQARVNNEEPGFWEALARENALRDIWNKYSAGYQEENGDKTLIMSFEEWKRLKAVSEHAMEVTSDARYPAEMSREANRVKTMLVKISEDLDKAFDIKDTKFLHSLRSEVTTLLAGTKSDYQMPATNSHKMLRILSRQVYADPEMYDIVDRLNHLGMCSADPVRPDGQGR